MSDHTRLPNLSKDELSQKQLDEVSAGGKAKQADSSSHVLFQGCAAGVHYTSATLY